MATLVFMDKKILKRKLSDEGFTHVYDWRDEPGTTYPPHAHKGKVTFYLTEGNLVFDFEGEKKEVKAGERFDVPVGKIHSATVGPNGATYIVGEEIKGDS